MDLLGHAQFIRSLRAEGPTQKDFRIMSPGADNTVTPISISITPAPATGSAADQTGFLVQVVYTQAPDNVIFTAVYPTQDVAQNVYTDLCNVAAQAEGEIKQENFEKAQESTKQFLGKCTANSGVKPTSQATNAPVSF